MLGIQQKKKQHSSKDFSMTSYGSRSKTSYDSFGDNFEQFPYKHMYGKHSMVLWGLDAPWWYERDMI